MTTFRIDSNETFRTEVTVRQSDPYTRAAYVKFDRHYIPEEIRGCNEMFMTPDELERLGMFLVEQAKVIRKQG
jgi:hypothetical protein